MAVVTYLPADIVRWLGHGAKQGRKKAIGRALSLPEVTIRQGIVPGLKTAADAAFGLGKQALGDFSTAKAEETGYYLYDDGFEAVGLLKKTKVDYADVTTVIHKGGDKFWVVHSGGHVTLRPVAHLVAGTQKVAIGWLRNGMEVDYMTLVEEIAARCGQEIEEE